MSLANRLIKAVLTALQLICVAGAYILDDLSHKKVGVNHHVVFMKRQYMQTILDADHLIFYRIIVGIALAVIAVYLLRHAERKYWRALLPLMLITLVIGLALTLPMVMDLPAYPYILFLIVIVWLLELVKAIFMCAWYR